MFKGQKTYITAGVAIVTSVAAYLTGDMTLADAIQSCVTAAMGAFIRHGVSTEAAKS